MANYKKAREFFDVKETTAAEDMGAKIHQKLCCTHLTTLILRVATKEDADRVWRRNAFLQLVKQQEREAWTHGRPSWHARGRAWCTHEVERWPEKYKTKRCPMIFKVGGGADSNVDVLEEPILMFAPRCCNGFGTLATPCMNAVDSKT